MAVRQRLPEVIRALKSAPARPVAINHLLPSLRRAFSLYDQINLIDNVPDDQLRFQQYASFLFFCPFVALNMLMLVEWIILVFPSFSFLIRGLRRIRYTDTGFKVNGVDYEGSLLCFGNLLMSWTPKKFSEITPDRYFSSCLCISVFLSDFPVFRLSHFWTHHKARIFGTLIIWRRGAGSAQDSTNQFREWVFSGAQHVKSN